MSVEACCNPHVPQACASRTSIGTDGMDPQRHIGRHVGRQVDGHRAQSIGRVDDDLVDPLDPPQARSTLSNLDRCRDGAAAGHDGQDAPVGRPRSRVGIRPRSANANAPRRQLTTVRPIILRRPTRAARRSSRRYPSNHSPNATARRTGRRRRSRRRGTADPADRRSGPGRRPPRRRAARSRSIGKTPLKSGRVSVPTTLSGSVNDTEPRDRRTSTMTKMAAAGPARDG